MDKNNLQPQVRFKGFTSAWEQRKLGDVVDVRSGRDYKHLSEGDIPVYGTGGYMLSVNEALSYSEDAIGIGRKGTIDKPYILKSPFWTVDTLFYAVPKQANHLNFLFDIFQNIDWKKKDESTGVPSLSKNAISEFSVVIPMVDEQKVIGTFFARLDTLITLHQRKCDKLQNVKKSMLEKMFPKNGSNVPEIRFKGFTTAWEQRKLGELCDITTGKLDANAMVQDGKYDFYTSGIDVFKIDEAVFEGPAITIAGNGASVGYMHLADGKFNAYQRTYVLTGFSADRLFLNVAIGNELPTKIQEEVRGSGIPYIVLNMISDLVIPLPSSEEQSTIGTFLAKLDNLITLHQRKLEKLKNIKKSCLEKMFV